MTTWRTKQESDGNTDIREGRARPSADSGRLVATVYRADEAPMIAAAPVLRAFVTTVANTSAAEASDDTYLPTLIEAARAILARVSA